MAAVKSEAATVAALDALNALADGGPMKFYSGTVPLTADAGAGTLLATITPLNSPAFNAATPGTTEATSTIDTTGGLSDAADAAGTVTYYRIESSGGVVSHQGTCGETGEDINFGTGGTNWNIGGVVTVTGLTVTLAV